MAKFSHMNRLVRLALRPHSLCLFALIIILLHHTILGPEALPDWHLGLSQTPPLFRPGILEEPVLPLQRSLLEIATLPRVHHSNVTAVLPVTEESVPHVERVLRQLLSHSNRPGRIVITSHPIAKDDVERAVQRVAKRLRLDELSIDLRIWESPDIDVAYASISAATSQPITTSTILILDAGGFGVSTPSKISALLNPPRTPVPVGFTGILTSPTEYHCTPSTTSDVPVAFLLPPLTVDADFIQEYANGIPKHSGWQTWAALGQRAAMQFGRGFGGILLQNPDAVVDQSACQGLESLYRTISERSAKTELFNPRMSPDTTHNVLLHSPGSAVLTLIFETMTQMQDFSNAACGLNRMGHIIRIFVLRGLNETDVEARDRPHTFPFFAAECTLLYTIPPASATSPYAEVEEWMSVTFKTLHLDVAVLSAGTQSTFVAFEAAVLATASSDVTIIRLPPNELGASGWMGSLSGAEWKNWRTPDVDLVVITNRRPKSLSRLLRSLNSALFFGDRVSLTIDMEQTADPETQEIVRAFEWSPSYDPYLVQPDGSESVLSRGGGIAVRHRVVVGGLMPAVAESWFPANENSYGIILEDDVEVSPMFYAWAKMNILRYKYGSEANKTAALFGISLYQPKVSELHLPRRKPFDATSLFRKTGLRHPNTPYLFAVPCSWGAVYFPEHWQQFHAYLSERLTEVGIPISSDIVPNVRSNTWSRSWKKYFIELVYLKGWVMLYPNYPNFVSLSTNHLEPGSHIKNMPEAKLDKKKKEYTVPLMRRPGSSAGKKSMSPQLLDIPYGQLPLWQKLPVLDLLADMTTLEALNSTGRARRAELALAAYRPQGPH